MIYKFLKPPDLFKVLLANYNGSYVEMCVPQTEDEKYCYAELTEKQFNDFVQHFGDNGEQLPINSEEYPASIQSKITNKIEKFTVVRPAYRDKLY